MLFTAVAAGYVSVTQIPLDDSDRPAGRTPEEGRKNAVIFSGEKGNDATGLLSGQKATS